MKHRFDIIQEWGEEKDTHYCFIRLYQTEYKKTLSFGNLTKTVNSLLTDTAKNNKRYTHAAINFQLNDNFVGVNFGQQGSAIKIEHLKTLGTEEGTPQDRENSKFDVYCLKLTKSEYEYLKKNLSNLKKNNKFKYSFFVLLTLSVDLLFGTIKNKLFSISKEDSVEVKEDLTQSEQGLICSTFVAFVLSKTSEIYKKYFGMTDKYLTKVTPNDLTYIPGIEFMFGGKWSEYRKKVNNFVNDNKEFKEYLN